MDLDNLVHQPTRLSIFAYLYRHGETGFSTLAEDLEISDGNLSSHLQTMEDAEALLIEKQFVEKRPQTTCSLTETGEELFESHVNTLESLIESLDDQTDS